MMKQYMLLVIALIAELIGLVASFVSAPKYGYLFAIVIFTDIVAIFILVHLYKLGGGWKWVSLILSIVVLYTLSDVLLRMVLGVRIMDLLK